MSKVNANVFQSLAPERVQVGNWLQHLLHTKKYARKNVFGTSGWKLAPTFAPHEKIRQKKCFWDMGKNKKPGLNFFPCAGKACKFNAAWQNDQKKSGPTFVRASRARRDFFQTRLRGVYRRCRSRLNWIPDRSPVGWAN